MSIRSRIDALERQVSPTGECACPGRAMEHLLCRDASVPPPPPSRCDLCGRRRRRIILGPVPWAKGEKPYEPLAGLRDYYERTVRPAYQPANADTIRALAFGAYEPATIDTVMEMMAPREPAP